MTDKQSSNDVAAKPASGRLTARTGGVFLLLLVLAAYASAASLGYVWDDDNYVTANDTLRDLPGLRRIWCEPGAVPQYYPVAHTSFWIEYHLWGLRPSGYHLTNVFLHALAAILLWLVLRHLGLPGAWLAAAVFAVHPIQVETVAWVTERKNTLSAVFYLAALLTYLRAVGRDRLSPVWNPRGVGLYLLSLGFFLGALGSKTVACSLPAVIMLLLWWQKPRWQARDCRAFLPLLPFFATGALMARVTVLMEKFNVGALGVEWDLDFLDRCLVAGRALWFYAGKLLWPFDLTFIYPRWRIDAGDWRQYLFPLGAAAAAVLLWTWRRRLGKGPLVAVLIYAGTLFPALGFFNIYPMRYSFVADHFQYLAGVGLICLAAGTATRLAAGRRGSAAAGLVLLALLALTWQRVPAFKNEETLWRNTLASNPRAWMAHNNLGLLLHERGDLPAAQQRFLDAIGYYRQDFGGKSGHANAHNNLALVLEDMGEFDRADEHYRRALEWDPREPTYGSNRAKLCARRSRFAEAQAQLEQVLQTTPDFVGAHLNLAIVFAQTGQPQKAEAHFRRALTLAPANAEAHFNYGIFLQEQGRATEALPKFRDAAKLDPSHAAANFELGKLLLSMGEGVGALRHLRQAVAANPNLAEAHFQIGVLLRGKPAEAVAHFRRAAEARPDLAEAHFNLGSTYSDLGEDANAVSHFRLGLEQKPNSPRAAGWLAWLLATSPDAALRRPAEAVTWGEKASSAANQSDPAILDQLAAAYAAAGRFEDAVRVAAKAHQLAGQQSKGSLANAIAERLTLYRQRRAFIRAPEG